MKTKTLSAIEQALADIGGHGKPRQSDEVAASQMISPGVSISTAQRRLKELYDAGKYERRKLGNEWLYRKVNTGTKTR